MIEAGKHCDGRGIIAASSKAGRRKESSVSGSSALGPAFTQPNIISIIKYACPQVLPLTVFTKFTIYASSNSMPSRIEEAFNVVVTGANGFIAQHCVAALLNRGYGVVGTVRSDQKALATNEIYKHDCFTAIVVDDITDHSLYVEALRSYSPVAIIHLASPFRYDTTNFEQELMIPAVQGALAVLNAASSLPTVKRVVLTSSFACILDAAAGPCPDKTYTAADWSPLTYNDGVRGTNAAAAYRASKAAAEKASWKFMASQRRHFDMVSLCPAMTFGPFLPGAEPQSFEEMNTSNKIIWNTLSAGKDGNIPPTMGPVWVDVRDVATAFVQALRVPEAGGRRFMLARDTYCNQEIADTARQTAPDYCSNMPLGEPGKRGKKSHYRVDVSETEKVLGVEFRDLAQCLRDTIPQLASMSH